MARPASAWCPGGRVAPNPEPRAIPCSTAPIRSGRSGWTGPGLCRRVAGWKTTGTDTTSVVQVLALQQLPDRLHLRPHLPPGVLQVGHDATISPPPDHHQHGRDETDRAPEDQPAAIEGDAAVRQEQGVQQQEADGEGRQRPGDHQRTGWRRAGRTMNGELGTAPSVARVVVSSSTWAPRNLTT